jgi:ethanolamine ammonia-lyase large subunit
LYLRSLLGLKRAPEFDRWLVAMGIADHAGRLVESTTRHPLLEDFATQWRR